MCAVIIPPCLIWCPANPLSPKFLYASHWTFNSEFLLLLCLLLYKHTSVIRLSQYRELDMNFANANLIEKAWHYLERLTKANVHLCFWYFSEMKALI